jgi:hypothetical protein
LELAALRVNVNSIAVVPPFPSNMETACEPMKGSETAGGGFSFLLQELSTNSINKIFSGRMS